MWWHCSGYGFPFVAAAVLYRAVVESDLTKMAAHSTQFEVRAVASDDLDLVHASKSGDVAAFEQLVKKYDRKLLRIAQSVTHNREDSQDAVQEAFLKAYQNLAEFRANSQFP